MTNIPAPVSSPIQHVCVYCGSAIGNDPSIAAAAIDLGNRLGDAGIGLVYGAASIGIMGTVADAILGKGGRAIGIIPSHILDREVGHPGLTELHIVESMHERKKMMVDRSDAFVIFPGGLGTLDETFEILTWKQLGLHNKPVIIANIGGFWDPLISLIDYQIAKGYVKPKDRLTFTVANTVDEVMTLLQNLPAQDATATEKM